MEHSNGGHFGVSGSRLAKLRVRRYCFICFVLCCWLSIHGASGGLVNNLRERIRGNSADRGNGDTVRQGHLSPVIIIPGDGGSQLEAWLNKPGVVNSLCPSKTHGWSRVWVDFSILVPTLIDCWIDNLRLYYNNVTRKSENAPGVQIRVPGFGDTDTIEYLTKAKLPQSRYFVDMVSLLVSHGYRRGFSIRAAPYDFRKAQNEQEGYFNELKVLVEETYEMNHKTKVTFIAHSLGNMYLLYFLNRQTQDWKDKYVSSFIGMGGPWAGAVKALKVVATGDDMDIPVVSGSSMREVLRTTPSSIALFPTDKVWSRNETLVATGSKNYNLNNLQEFFTDIGHPEGWDIYQDTKGLTYDLTPPNVKVYCISGTGVSTPAMYFYGPAAFPHLKPTIVSEDGDGTVNRKSLDACGLWSTHQSQAVESKTFHKAGHLKMVRKKAVLDHIVSILFPET